MLWSDHRRDLNSNYLPLIAKVLFVINCWRWFTSDAWFGKDLAFLNLLQKMNFIIIVDYTYFIGDVNQTAIVLDGVIKAVLVSLRLHYACCQSSHF